jgi:hypothetical protein
VDGAFRGIWIALMRGVGLVGGGVKLDNGALGLALDRLRSLLDQYQYWWSASTGAVGRSLVGTELVVTVSNMRALGDESGRKKHT